ncbi:cation:proton antiporter [Sphingomonas morindae]|uniref:Cation:proton antiporter n=2 Tax=Sphingomonas morindae TaxID=1541170 RepID=A0ABY4XC54_9SPHN|nr:cation:proton antiporter [Sphingomonas morindae]USI74560.1 cation:proton antiporter [Sphingomonas morindae]
MAPAQLSVAFFLEGAAILATARAMGFVAQRWLGQPRVVGEMIAGVLLGPSLLGLIAPAAQALLFPPETKPILYVIAQLGVGLYMFIVGLGFSREGFAEDARAASLVSMAGMALPFVGAALLVPMLLPLPGLFAPGLGAGRATLFLGACIAITAFPMLARIIHERGLSGTPLGTLALAAGAVDDAGAWTVLAVVLATFGGGALLIAKTLGGALLFAALVLGLGPRLLRPLGRRVEAGEDVDHGALALVLGLFLLAAFAMDAVGMHAVFGGFLLGTVMPRGRLTALVRAQVEPLTVVLLLPFFFVYSGLNTRLSLLADPALLLIALAVLAVSVIAKGGACWAAARLAGKDNATAAGIGALMNARGLMELIILNIGLDRGIIGPRLFSILVLMAVLTTFIASPLFEWSRRLAIRRNWDTRPIALP